MYYAFYGSLRRGLENHRLYADHLKYQFSFRLAGFKLYSLGEYPCAVPSSLRSDSIVVEIFEIGEPNIALEIDNMEIEAGYYIDNVTVNGILSSIFLFKEADTLEAVKGGDWLKFIENRNV